MPLLEKAFRKLCALLVDSDNGHVQLWQVDDSGLTTPELNRLHSIGLVEKTKFLSETALCPNCSTQIHLSSPKNFYCADCQYVGNFSGNQLLIFKASIAKLEEYLIQQSIFSAPLDKKHIAGIYELGTKDYLGWKFRTFLWCDGIVGNKSQVLPSTRRSIYPRTLILYLGEEPVIEADKKMPLLDALVFHGDGADINPVVLDDIILGLQGKTKNETTGKFELLLQKHIENKEAGGTQLKADFLDEANRHGLPVEQSKAYWQKNAPTWLKNPGRPPKTPAKKPSKNR